MINIKRKLSIFIVICIIFSGSFSVHASGSWKDTEDEEGVYYLDDYASEIEYIEANHSNEENAYNEHWEYWSQGASKYRYTSYGGRGPLTGGCMILSFCKLLVESGIASGDINEFNPDIFYEWGMTKGHYNGVSAYMKGHSYDTFAAEHEAELVREDGYLHGDYESKNDQLMELLKDGKYIVLIANGHYAYVLREVSLDLGQIIVSDSSSQYSQSANSVYSLSSSKYNFYAYMSFSVYFTITDEDIIGEDYILITNMDGVLPVYTK